MEATIQTTYPKQLDSVNTQMRQMVLAGVQEAELGKTYDADEVFDRLEKRYSNEKIQS